MPAPSTPAVTLNGGDLFADLIREAQRLGFRLQVAPELVPGTAGAFLEPVTPRARALCRTAHGERTAGIEASCPYAERRDALDATRAAAECALRLARDAGA